MSDKNKTYCLINYGCQMNESDTEHYAGQLQELGYAPNPDFHTADIIIVNTCCVRESAEKKIAGKIGELKAVKRANPDVVICVAGCMAQKDGEKLRKKHPQVDLLLGTAYVNDFKRLLLEFLAERKAAVYTDLTIHQSEFEGHMVRQSSFAAWIPIMYGCNNFCTYCIVPYVRGRERSREMSAIVAEAEALRDSGVKEIMLLGQNVNSYGKGLQTPVTFAQLLKALDDVGIPRIRFMTSHPKDLSDELIDVMAHSKHILPQFHLPVQHGNDEILRRMNRHYNRAQYLDRVRKLREAIPAIGLTTDIIVGFPGETEEQFQDTLSLVREVGYDSAFTFIYSPRTGTGAAKMPNQVPEDVSSRRIQELLKVQEECQKKAMARFIGTEEEVLVEGLSRRSDTDVSGHGLHGLSVTFPGTESDVGEIVRVKIVGAKNNTLTGERI